MSCTNYLEEAKKNGVEVYVYSRSKKNKGELIERFGYRTKHLNGHNGYSFQYGNKLSDYMNNLSSEEGVVKCQTVWFYEPNKEGARLAFEKKDKEMAVYYASKCKLKVVCG